MKSMFFAILAVAFFQSSLLPVSGADQQTDGKESILNNTKAFVDVIGKGDTKVVTAFWAEGGGSTTGLHSNDLLGQQL
jgi:hypothetical protein